MEQGPGRCDIDDVPIREWVLLRGANVVFLRLIQTLLDHISDMSTTPPKALSACVSASPAVCASSGALMFLIYRCNAAASPFA
eukprot:CAMPEP_0195648000 /NCGR_PEP_ID=MMETSP0815-20121206/30400_1 /TAXON_ID=97485 /ORGANISM="Prymnesium parvum, Strain Texoma1" /LENGTH=82 /DNA_ID=CAMNT_0040791609 /DNA_START=93 /DNA_END=338 /DNA_ORIENTATION=-